ncbi:MAG: site-2 protease family protein [Vicinamibacterales bacterium]
MDNIDFQGLLVAFLVLLVSLTVHEAAHAWSADRLGDPTARLLGRLSLNPAVHVDPIGTVLFPLIAMVTGFPLIGWAKPVPVDMRHLRSPRRDFALIALAGPVSNLVLAVIGAVVLRALTDGGVTQLVAGFFLFVRVNVLLAVFNLIPVPPLDGGNVLMGILPPSAADIIERLRPYGFILLYVLMLSGALSIFVWPLGNLVLSWLL